MNEHEAFERELRRLCPATLPEDFAARLTAARRDVAPPHAEAPARTSQPTQAWRWLRWWVPATAAAACLVVLVSLMIAPRAGKPGAPPTVPAPPLLRADDVEIDRQLVGVFEAVATLPSGEPVRIRCREWVDDVILRDTARGVAIEQRTPRFEVIPVRFETF